MSHDDALTTLFRHHLWANLRLLDGCAALSDEQLDASAIGGYGTLRDTWEHIALAERSYFSRISTGQRYAGDDKPQSLAEIGALLRATGEGLIEWAPRVQPDDTVEIDWDGTPRAVPKTIILTQVVNHATEHRAQIMAILTHLGIEPPYVAGWAYFEEMMG